MKLIGFLITSAFVGFILTGCACFTGNCKGAQCGAKAETAPATTTAAVTPKASPSFKAIYFEVNRHKLSDEATTYLKETAELLKQHPDMKVVASGFCDSSGTPAVNKKLGMNRIANVKTYLEKNGVRPDQIVPENKGAEGGTERKVTFEIAK